MARCGETSPGRYHCRCRLLLLVDMETLLVRTTAGGVPVALVVDGRKWQVGAVPVRWFERTPWWDSGRPQPRGNGSRIDVEVWQVQARIGKNPHSPLVTFELVRDQDGDSWAVRAQDGQAA